MGLSRGLGSKGELELLAFSVSALGSKGELELVPFSVSEVLDCWVALSSVCREDTLVGGDWLVGSV